MFSGMGSAQDTNARWHMLLREGQTGLSTAFDFPTLMGYDSDSPKALGEVGKCGVAIDTLEDFLALIDDIPLDQVTTSMTINPPATVLWAMYCAAADIKGVPLTKIGGTIQNDMLKEFIAQKTFMCPPEPSVKLISDTVEFGTKYVPALEHNQHQRLSHPGSGRHRRAGTGFHAARRHRIRRRCYPPQKNGCG